jgi:hypothetical protein
METLLAHVTLLAEGDGSSGRSTFGLLLTVVMVVAAWRVFTKAGRQGWAALVPGYNLLILLRITGKPLWWLLLFLIPGVNFVASILVGVALARKFDKGALFGIGLTFLPFIFLPILGFGASTYSAQR